MPLLTKKQIIDSDDLKTETITVPEWGGEVMVKTWTAVEKAEFEFNYDADKTGKDKRQIRQIVVARTVVDAKGKLLFALKDVAALSKKSGAALDQIFEVASRLNHILPSDEETLVKNSEKTAD